MNEKQRETVDRLMLLVDKGKFDKVSTRQGPWGVKVFLDDEESYVDEEGFVISTLKVGRHKTLELELRTREPKVTTTNAIWTMLQSVLEKAKQQELDFGRVCCEIYLYGTKRWKP